jgi:hypothetical protein
MHIASAHLRLRSPVSVRVCADASHVSKGRGSGRRAVVGSVGSVGDRVIRCVSDDTVCVAHAPRGTTIRRHATRRCAAFLPTFCPQCTGSHR